MVDVYGQNYSPNERASRVAVVLMIFASSSLIFSPICGKLLDINLKNYGHELLIVALAAIGSGMSLSKIPARVLPHAGKSIFSNFGTLFDDKLFGMMSLWWIFMGIANQMTTPLRTEYLTNAAFGVNETNLFVTHACVTVPIIFRILSSPLWGRFFDRSNVVPIKIAINIFLIIGFWMFFHSTTRAMILAASALIGIAYGGGEMMLHLWVTKIVDSEKFSRYMSANVSVVGLVGLFSPFLGYNLLHYFSLQQISIIASMLLLVSIFGFFTLRNHPRFADS
jgi:hypothetical protein